MSHKAFRAILGLSLLAAPAVTGAEEASVYRLPPPRIACDAASGVLDQAGHVIEGSVRKRCDALWSQSTKVGGVGGWRYDDFMSQCSQSCPAPRPLSEASSVPQLNTLGSAAAQSASGGTGLGNTLFVVSGLANALGVGLAASASTPGPDDQPASP
jgi:hypothetical protein